MENSKKCSKCGRELPVSEFWKNASTEDGLQTYCKECGNVYARNRKKTPGGNLKKIYSNPELAKFSPRELIAELKARGYTGELKYTQTYHYKWKSYVYWLQPNVRTNVLCVATTHGIFQNYQLLSTLITKRS